MPGVPAASEAAGGYPRLALATQQKPFLKSDTRPGIIAYAFNPSTLEAEVNRFLLEASLVYLVSDTEYQTNQVYIVRPCLRKECSSGFEISP